MTYRLKHAAGVVALLAFFSLFLTLLATPAHAALPPVPPSCTATVQSSTSYLIEWTPVTANPAVNWYSIKVKGTSATPKQASPSTDEYVWTFGTNGASSPLTFLVASHNPDGRSAWCEAVVGSPPPPTNQAPTVNAGADTAVQLPNSVNLDGTVSDDGLPTTGSLTQTWSKVSGPGTVTFGNANAVDTTASFGAAGDYVLRLTASDGALSSSDTVAVSVTNAPPPTNVAPSVSAGPDSAVERPNAATLDGTVTDDGLPNGTLTQTWTKVSGPGTVTFANANAVDTTATFSAVGDYVLRLTATDGELSNSDTVNVAVTDPPPPGGGDNAELLGVRVFPHYSGATYGNHAEVLQILDELGTQRISGLMTPSMSADEIKFYQDANALGIKVWFAVGTPGTVLSDSQWTQVRNLFSGPLNGIADAASGWNEPNHQVGGDWSTITANHQAKLWTNIQQVNAATGQDIEVGTPPLWSGNINTQYNDLDLLAPKIQGEYDLINWHLYPHGNDGAALEAMIDRQKTEFQQAYGTGIPILNSESGYFTAANYSGGSNPSTEAEQAAELPLLADYHLERGIMLSYFELLNDPDPSQANREANFGLVRTPSLDPSTWTYKPAFFTYRDKIAE